MLAAASFCSRLSVPMGGPCNKADRRFRSARSGRRQSQGFVRFLDELLAALGQKVTRSIGRNPSRFEVAQKLPGSNKELLVFLLTGQNRVQESDEAFSLVRIPFG